MVRHNHRVVSTVVAQGIRSAFSKQRRGEKLTASDRKVIRDYHREASRRSTRLYWDTPDQKAHYEALAEREGARIFSRWLISQIQRGTRASTITREEITALRLELARTRNLLENEVETNRFLRRQFELAGASNVRTPKTRYGGQATP